MKSQLSIGSLKRISIMLLLAFVSILLSFLVRFNFRIPIIYLQSLGLILGVNAALKLMLIFLINRKVAEDIRTRHVHFLTFLAISFISPVVLIGFNLGFNEIYYRYLIPNSVVLLDFIFFTNAIILYRIIYHSVVLVVRRYWNHTHSISKTLKNLFLYLGLVLTPKHYDDYNLERRMEQL